MSGKSDVEDPRYLKLKELESTKEVKDYLVLVRQLRKVGVFKDSLAVRGIIDSDNPQKSIGHLGQELTHRLPYYAKFLPDGFFEFFMPVTSLDKSSKEYKLRLCAMFWIASRFPDWQDFWWDFYNHLHIQYYQRIEEWADDTNWKDVI